MSIDVSQYVRSLDSDSRLICERLGEIIGEEMPDAENKVWHAHPVWFIEGNPIVGFSKLKDGVRLMFWSGADFDEPGLSPGTGKFKDASMTYQSVEQVNPVEIRRWLDKSKSIQWNYRDIVKNRGRLDRIK
jgi:hypothetical protein